MLEVAESDGAVIKMEGKEEDEEGEGPERNGALQ